MTTCSGHYCLPLLEETASTLDLEWALSVDLSQLSEKEQKQKMEKLHKQFGHYSKAKFLLFMKDAKAEYAGMEKHIDEIIQRCEGCLLKNRKPDKPVVALPLAREFNEKVAVDLKVLSNPSRYILHMIDMWSRYSISTTIARKKPDHVVHAIMNNWIKYLVHPFG